MVTLVLAAFVPTAYSSAYYACNLFVVLPEQNASRFSDKGNLNTYNWEGE